MAIEHLVNKALKQFEFKSHHSGNISGYGGVSSPRSNMNCHKCGREGNIHKHCRSKGTGSSGNTPKKITNEIPEWVTKKPVVSDTKDLETATMTHHNKKLQVVHLL